MYDLPKINFNNSKEKIAKLFADEKFKRIIILLVILVVSTVYAGVISVNYLKSQAIYFLQKIESGLPKSVGDREIFPFGETEQYATEISYEQAIINAVKEASSSVVSIIISKNLPVYEQIFIDPFEDFPGFGSPLGLQIPQYVQKGTELKQIGAGSGFIVSEDGLVLTNKHVVLDKEAEYTVLLNDGRKFSAKVLALDPIQDLAVAKIEGGGQFKAIKLGDSDGIQIGQTAVVIGNALGEFRNTVSVGVISGLGRTISASGGGGFSETLENIIQTDAAINSGNSGGPLLNLKGEVIGINTAMAQDAQSIGFAIPINVAKRDINQVAKTSKITYPFLGVRYVVIDVDSQKKYKTGVDYGALILRGSDSSSAVTPNSAADKAGLKENDLILEFNGEKITKDNSLSKIIAKYNVGDKITLKILRDGSEITVEVVLGERE